VRADTVTIDAVRDYIARVARSPYQLGVDDCMTFVVDCILIRGGRDYRPYLGYYDRRTAVARLRAAGGIRPACCEVWGAERPVAELSIGDVVFVRSRHAGVGLLMPNRVLIKSHCTIERLPIDSAMFGWRV
jgi:hypothetical protein